jgi:hypothetical protein
MMETLLARGERVILNFPNLADPVAMERIVSLSQCEGLLVCIPELSLRQQAYHLASTLQAMVQDGVSPLQGAWVRLIHWVYAH